MACPPGKILNPRTLKCISAAGKTAQGLVQRGNIPDYYAQPLRQTAKRPTIKQCKPGQERHPITGRCRKIVAPSKTRKRPVNVLVQSKCRNDRDPITGLPLDPADPTIVHLHDNTCVLADTLHAKVAAEHKAGQLATIPGDPSSHMTLADFDALRRSMRQRYPDYKLPRRKHQPPPSTWQLYIAQDNRSGPDFASVMFIDVVKAQRDPAESIRVDLGFIPVKIAGNTCSPQMLVDLITRLTNENRLLVPVAGGWKPIAGFPYTKAHWTTPTRVDKLCRDLIKAL